MCVYVCILQWWICVIVHLSEPMECTTPRVNPDVNYRLWVMMSPSRFINYNKCTTVVWEVVHMKGSVQEFSALSASFFCKLL